MPKKEQGRLAVKHKGPWGTVCADRFDKRDASVACKEMGHKEGFVLLPNKLSR